MSLPNSSSPAGSESAGLPKDWLKSCRQDVDLTDVTLHCEDRDFQAHRFILAYQSPVFRAMMRGPYKEAEESDIGVGITDADTLERLLSAMYSHDYDDAQPVLPSETMTDRTYRTPSNLGKRYRALIQRRSKPIRNARWPASLKMLIEPVFINLCVYKAADYYQIAHVSELATRKFGHTLDLWISLATKEDCPVKSGLVRIAEHIRDTIPKEHVGPILKSFLKRLVTSFAILKAEDGCVEALAGVRSDFAAGIISILDKDKADLQAKTVSSADSLKQAKDEKDELQDKVDRFFPEVWCRPCKRRKPHKLANTNGYLQLRCVFCGAMY